MAKSDTILGRARNRNAFRRAQIKRPRYFTVSAYACADGTLRFTDPVSSLYWGRFFELRFPKPSVAYRIRVHPKQGAQL